MNRLLWITIGFLCLFISSCNSNDEPEPPYNGPWEITYAYIGSGMSKPNTEFEKWAKGHKSQVIFAIPPLDDKDFSYSNSIVYWREYVTDSSEEDVANLTDSFINFNEENSTSCSAVFQRYDASYTGPWRIIYNESFYRVHNDNDSFKLWFNEHKSAYSCIMAHQNSYPNTFDDYLKCEFGFSQWVETIDNISEANIRENIQEFRNFSTPKNFFGTYDYFDAYYQKIDGK